jgi:hypothetical protein
MKKTTSTWFLILLSTATLVGCSSSAPSCADSKTINMVKQIVEQRTVNIKKNFSVDAEYEITLENIRESEFNKQTGKYSCVADLEVKSNNLYLMLKKSINYTTELTQPKKEPYVTIYGL